MTMRSAVGAVLRATIGPERTRRLARRVDRQPGARVEGGPTSKVPSRYRAPDPWTPAHPTTVTHYAFLAEIHERLRPRTYVEVGVRHGDSLALSRARSIGIDPAYQIKVDLHADVQLVRSTSDEFFARADAFDHLGGVPVDFAFIDGMHLSEFAYRDFIGIEPKMARAGVVALDDMLPRNALEAARHRETNAWAGDVYKVVEVLRRRRPDLAVVLVNTRPTGTALVFGADPDHVGVAHADDLAYFEAPDPQDPPPGFLDRSAAVAVSTALESPVWDLLIAERDEPSAERRQAILDEVRGWPTLGPVG